MARHLCGVVLADDREVPAGAAVWTADGEHEVGSLSSVARSAGLGAYVALGTLHRRVSPPEAVEVRWVDAGAEVRVPGEARPLPLTHGA